ncbi:unnamed protein product [Ambrosiozyma monospora]|uniref:Unnamed protein product n=1 Tax=Ambrosiozyma monospora TaxID=43982 RepID=A0ACB5TAJ3_AMBMO|nr:unnamed protein product [Ambrosiozyma monospora]
MSDKSNNQTELSDSTDILDDYEPSAALEAELEKMEIQFKGKSDEEIMEAFSGPKYYYGPPTEPIVESDSQTANQQED